MIRSHPTAEANLVAKRYPAGSDDDLAHALKAMWLYLAVAAPWGFVAVRARKPGAAFTQSSGESGC
jgi:hypothetical protein